MSNKEKSEINFSLEKRKTKVKEVMKDLTTPSIEDLDELVKLDETNEKVMKAKLDLNMDDEFLIKSYDTLSKDNLKKYKVNKRLNNRDAYFYFLTYIMSVNLVNITENNISENTEQEEKFIPQILIDFSEGKLNFVRINEREGEAKKQMDSFNKEDNKNAGKKYKEFIEKRNLDIMKFFELKETITLKELRKKLSEYQKILSFFDYHRKNIPDFQSELYFHYQLENVIQSFIELKEDEDFLSKIQMISDLYKFIEKVRKNEIKDLNMLTYFYFVMDLEYSLPSLHEKFLNLYRDENISFKDTVYKSETNQLIINKNDNSEIVIDNIDCFALDEEDIKRIVDGQIKLPLSKNYHSIKGNLLLRELSKAEGNIIYEHFLKSPLLKEIIFILYGIEREIFSNQDVIETFKDNTFYFPIYNSSYDAYTEKELFKIFIDYKISNITELRKFKTPIIKFAKNAFMTVNIEHEFGHAHKAFLYYYDYDTEDFDSPMVKITLNLDEQIELKEGGLIIEYSLYGREIKELNFKEIIYINNYNNFSKSLKDYRNDFINLKNESLINVFEREGKNNNEITEIYGFFKSLPNEEKNALETQIFKSGKRNNNIPLDLEKVTFIFGGTKDHNKKHKKQYNMGGFKI